MCEINGCTNYAVYTDVEDYNYLCKYCFDKVVIGEL